MFSRSPLIVGINYVGLLMGNIYLKYHYLSHTVTTRTPSAF